MNISVLEVGKEYGMLTAISRADNRGSRLMWLFKCQCGNLKEIQACRVAKGTTKSCGCINAKNAGIKNFKHGQIKHPIYKIWSAMRRRCNNPKDRCYNIYGGKGIRVCEDWDTFSNFYNDMAETYQHGLYIDRIDPNKGYSPDNCRWVTVQVSGQNRGNVKMTPEILRIIRTEKATAKQLAERFNCGVATINDVRQGISWSNVL